MTAWLREANALSKVLFAVSLCMFTFYCQDWRILAGIVAGLFLVMALVRELDRTLWLVVALVVTGMPVILLLCILGGIEKAPTWREGIILGASWYGLFSLRLMAVVLADLLVVKLTSFSNLILSLRSLRLPSGVVLFTSALISMLPNILAMALRVIEVQRCRGFDSKKMLRPSSFLPLFIPVFLAQMRRSADLALSLELRGISTASFGTRGHFAFGGGDALFYAAALLVWSGPLWTAFSG